MLYAGAQKNAGPAGVVICIIRDDMLEKVPANLPNLLDYKALAEENSLLNTPPCWSIYIVGLVLKWAKGIGGLEGIAKRNQTKAGMVYKTIDESGGFYKGHAKSDRSLMNVTFRLPTSNWKSTFAGEAKKQDMIGLKGHRSVGGMRASLYNALPVEAAEEPGQVHERVPTKERVVDFPCPHGIMSPLSIGAAILFYVKRLGSP